MGRVSVTAIIVSYGHGATLPRAVDSLQHLGGDLREVVVVDNAGDLGETRLGTVGRVVPDLFDPGENLGFSAAVNRVARESRSGVLLLLSPDAEVVSWDGDRVSAEFDDNIGAIGALTLGSGDRPDLSWGEFPGVRALARRLSGRRSADRRGVFARLAAGVSSTVDWVLGAAVLVPKAKLEAAGGFDEQYFSSGEDQDFGARLAGICAGCVVSPAWVVRHVPRSPEDLRSEIRANNRRFVARHGSVADRFAWNLVRIPDVITARKRVVRENGD